MEKQIPQQVKHYVVSGHAASAAAAKHAREAAAGVLPLPKQSDNPMGWGQRFDPTATGRVEDRRGIEGLIAAGKPGAAAVLENPFIYFNDEVLDVAKPNTGAC